ncbi:MAG: hypothetical protein M3Y57_12720 [Acidobacteriota bacterium]|nr:hypothetical protein [Acidobacteriota bacterium]
MVAIMESAEQETDRDAAAKRIRLQFIKQAIETASDLARLAIADRQAGHAELAEEARRRALKTHKEFQIYLPFVSDQLTRSERAECEESLNNLRDALRGLE